MPTLARQQTVEILRGHRLWPRQGQPGAHSGSGSQNPQPGLMQETEHPPADRDPAAPGLPAQPGADPPGTVHPVQSGGRHAAPGTHRLGRAPRRGTDSVRPWATCLPSPGLGFLLFTAEVSRGCIRRRVGKGSVPTGVPPRQGQAGFWGVGVPQELLPPPRPPSAGKGLSSGSWLAGWQGPGCWSLSQSAGGRRVPGRCVPGPRPLPGSGAGELSRPAAAPPPPSRAGLAGTVCSAT